MLERWWKVWRRRRTKTARKTLKGRVTAVDGLDARTIRDINDIFKEEGDGNDHCNSK